MKRTASAITDVDVVDGVSLTTTVPVVPALNGCAPSVVHTPPVPRVWSTVYVLEPPEYATVYGTFVSRSFAGT